MANAPNSEVRTVYGPLPGCTLASARINATLHATSVVSASTYTTVGSNLAAIITEITNTLVALGAWA